MSSDRYVYYFSLYARAASILYACIDKMHTMAKKSIIVFVSEGTVC